MVGMIKHFIPWIIWNRDCDEIDNYGDGFLCMPLSVGTSNGIWMIAPKETKEALCERSDHI